MTIRNIPLQPANCCFDPQAKLSEMVEFFLTAQVNHAAVCEGGAFVGMVGINEMLQALLPTGATLPHGVEDLSFVGDGALTLVRHLHELQERPATDFLMSNVTPLPEDCPLTEAALLLTRHRFPLPVVGSDGSFKGLLSRRVLLQHIATLS